jgi:hypothetical protein
MSSSEIEYREFAGHSLVQLAPGRYRLDHGRHAAFLAADWPPPAGPWKIIRTVSGATAAVLDDETAAHQWRLAQATYLLLGFVEMHPEPPAADLLA